MWQKRWTSLNYIFLAGDSPRKELQRHNLQNTSTQWHIAKVNKNKPKVRQGLAQALGTCWPPWNTQFRSLNCFTYPGKKWGKKWNFLVESTWNVQNQCLRGNLCVILCHQQQVCQTVNKSSKRWSARRVTWYKPHKDGRWHLSLWSLNVSETIHLWLSLSLRCLSQFFQSTVWPHFILAGVEQPFNCFNIRNRQAMQSMERSMDLTLKDNMVDGLFFCATLTGRREGKRERKRQTSVRRRLNRTHAVLERFFPGGWVSGMEVRSLVVLSNHSTFRRWSAQSAALLISDKLTSCYAAGTNGCLRFKTPSISTRWTAER